MASAKTENSLENMNRNKRIESICPVCRRKIEARILTKGDRVYLEKECYEHGCFQDIYWSDIQSYDRAENLRFDGEGLENPRTETKKGCPLDCGICPQHKSMTLLAILDVTNRCNLRCPICFANAENAGYTYEPSKEQIFTMLDNLRKNRPLPAPALQFSGGEPTLRVDLPELIRMAKKQGFLNIEVNGIKLAQSLDFCRTLKDAGLDTIYLQFDGLTSEVHKFMRGRDLVDIKNKAIDNCRRVGIYSIVLVVTLIKGINESQLGDIIRFAADNFDVIRCINVQPISFTGRIPKEKLEKYRITIPDFMKHVEEQTNGQIQSTDFYPVPSVVPISKAVGALKNERFPEFTAHPHCGMATYFFLNDGKIVPINRYANVDKILGAMKKVFDTASKGQKLLAKLQLMTSLLHIKFGMLRKYLWPVLTKGSFKALETIHYRMILLSTMHFMDAYNFDLDRVRRCVIHYAAPDGRIIPFCAYNNLGYREEIEKKFRQQKG
jgi:uncharacterized radical SAM superfamily Fe-S cluster-containing enzyme